jgi:hypothetical protein
MTRSEYDTNSVEETEKAALAPTDASPAGDGTDNVLTDAQQPPKKRGRSSAATGGGGEEGASKIKSSKKGRKGKKEASAQGDGEAKKSAEDGTNGVEAALAGDDAAPAGDDAAPAGDEAASKTKSSSHKKKGRKGKKTASAEGDAKEGEEAPKKKKPVKKPVPFWATLSDNQAANLKASQRGTTGATGVGIIIGAIKECANEKGLASYINIKKHILQHHPNWPKMVFKTSLRRAVDNGRVKQFKNSYKIVSEAPKKEAKVQKKVSKSRSKTVTVSKDCNLEELFPHIFTWVLEPKEASSTLIKKYLQKHFPNLSIEAPFKKALENMVAKGQLDQITGKGLSGTFQLLDGAKKSGTAYEDPIEDAIIASNEPKDASVPALRHYLSEYHTEYNVKDNPKVLRRALERAEAMGWIIRITGKGFSGTFRLSYPYIPSPKDLWRGDYKPTDYEPKSKKSRTYDSSSDEESDEEEESAEEEEEGSSEADSSDYDEDTEVVPKKKKRGAPTARDETATRKPKPKKGSAGGDKSPKKRSAGGDKSKGKKKSGGSHRRRR